MTDLMKKALAKAQAGTAPTSKWLARNDFNLAVEDMVEFTGSFDEWKSEIAKGRTVDGRLVYLTAFLQWLNAQS